MSLIDDLLNGGMVKPREAPTQGADLGSMLAFLSQNNTPQLPQVQHSGGDGSGSLYPLLQGIQMYQQHGQDQKEEELAAGLAQSAPTAIDALIADTKNAANKGQLQLAKMLFKSKIPSMQGKATDIVKSVQDKVPPIPSLVSEAEAVTGLPISDQKTRDFLKQYMMKSGVTVNNIPEGLPKAAQGYMWNKDLTRQMPIPGGPADQTIKPLTDAEGKSASYSKRMADAHKALAALESTLKNSQSVAPLSAKQWSEHIPGIGGAVSAAINKELDPKLQIMDTAQREFVNALLRHESGATINPEEFENYRKQYFPVYGDSPATLKYKQQERALAIKGMDLQAGPASPNWKAKVAGEGETASAPLGGGKQVVERREINGRKLVKYSDGTIGEE